MILEPVTAEDDAALVGWFDDADALRRFAGDTLQWPLTPAQLRSVRAEHAWTAWDDGRRVGHAELVPTDGGGARLVRVAVAPGERGRGLGRQLLSAVIEQARTLGLSQLDLNVYPDNHAAVRLYRSAGFEQQAAGAEYLRMARSLG